MSALATPPTYRERLRVEGAVLAASALLVFVSESGERAGSTIGQIAFVAVLGPLPVRRWRAAAQPVDPAAGYRPLRLPGSRAIGGTKLGFFLDRRM